MSASVSMRSTKRLLLLHSELVPSADKFIDVPSSFIHARLYESFAEKASTASAAALFHDTRRNVCARPGPRK